MRELGVKQKVLRFVKKAEVTTIPEIVAALSPPHLAREVRGCIVSLIVHEQLIRHRTAISLPPKGGISLVELGRRLDRAIKAGGFTPLTSARDHLNSYGKSPKIYDE